MVSILRKLVALGLLIAIPAVPVYGAWVVQPSAEMKTSYDDNVRLSTEELEDAGFVNTAMIQARVANITETTQVSGVIAASFVDYAQTRDTEDSDNLVLRFIADQRFERGSVGATVSAERDSVFRYAGIITDPFSFQDESEIDRELNDLADNAEDVDEAVIREQLERTRFGVAPQASYNINSRTTASLRYQYYEVQFDDEDLANQFGAQDTETQTATASMRRTLTERSSATMSVSTTKFDPKQDAGSDAYEVNLGIDRQMSERTSLRATIGVNRVSPDIGEDNDGNSGSLEITHATNNGLLRASIRRSLYPSAYGEILESDMLQFSYRHRFSARFAASIGANGISSSSNQGQSNQDRDFFAVNPEVVWAFSENLQITAGYQFTWNDRENESGDATSNALFLSFSYQPRSEI